MRNSIRCMACPVTYLVRLLLAVLICVAASPAQEQGAKFDSDTVSGLGARNIGSAAMSGRVSAIAAVKEDGRLTVYIGSASGGVWKSINGGTTYKPVFDKQDVQSIGAIAIDPSAAKTIWVGTGEAWTRKQHLRGRRYLQIDGRRRQLDQRRPEKFRAHCEDPSRSQRQQCGIRLRPGKAVERQRGPRTLQDQRWRQVLEQNSEGGESFHGLLDDFHGPE